MRRVVEGFRAAGRAGRRDPDEPVLAGARHGGDPGRRAATASAEIRTLQALVTRRAPPERVLAAVAKAAPREHHVALVGHEPDLGTLAAWLIGRDSAAAVQEGRDLPDRRRPLAGRSGGPPRVVRDAEDAQIMIGANRDPVIPLA